MVVVTTLPRGRALTRADLDAMPDDGHRYELVDGALVVTPAPGWQHQRVVTRLWRRLADVCPDDMEVFVAPLDVALAHDTVLQPDVLVARRRDLGQRDLPAPPVLAVEVGSPSTWRIDRTLKRSRFEAAGCPAYWVVDPGAPSLTAWLLGNGGEYVLDAEVGGPDIYRAQRPFAVSVSPIELTCD
jgi:Uma2 family endonuclease